MEKSLELLKKIYQNAKTATDAIDILIEKTDSDEFLNTLKNQQKKYLKIKEQAIDGIKDKMGDLPKESIFSRLEVYAVISLGAGNKKKTDHAAKTLINGSAEGITEIKSFLKSSKNEGEFASELAGDLIKTEEENIRLMQKYL